MSRKNLYLIIICLLSTALLISCGKSTGQNNQGQGQDQSQGQGVANWQEQYDLGLRYLSEGNYEEAIIAFTAAIEIDPNQALAYVGRGDAYALSGDTEENLAAALADYEAALALDETLASAWLGLADVHIRQGDYDRALEVLQEGLQKTGGDQTIADKIVEIEAGQITDSSGNIRRMNGYVEGEFAWYHIFDYNALGQRTSITVYDAAGNQIDYFELVYDEEGRVLKSEDYSSETGKMIGYVEYEYDDMGNVVKDTLYSMDGTLSSYNLHQYDSTGKRISSERYERDNRLRTRTEYDEHGQPVKRIWSDGGYDIYEYDGEEKLLGTKTYGENGNLLHYLVYLYGGDGERIGYEHYDADGNLDYSTENVS